MSLQLYHLYYPHQLTCLHYITFSVVYQIWWTSCHISKLWYCDVPDTQEIVKHCNIDIYCNSIVCTFLNVLISYIFLCLGFLMCGTLKGVFAFLPVTLRNDVDQEPVVTVKEMCKVWDEEDWVAVDHIAVLKVSITLEFISLASYYKSSWLCDFEFQAEVLPIHEK